MLALKHHLETENQESSSSFLNLVEDNRDEWLQSQTELEYLYLSHVDHGSISHIELFLAILHQLLPDLSPDNIISIWFDLILRPALKDPRLPLSAVIHARQIVHAAVCPLQPMDTGKIHHFRQRLFDLYLLDAFNETSEYDVLEWNQLQPEEQHRRNSWKSNLQNILLRFASCNSNDFLSHVNDHFLRPSSRIQLLILLNSYASLAEFQQSAKEMAQHPVMASLLSSLLLDNSSTASSLGLTLLGHLLPVFAVHATSDLKQMLPRLLAILGRVICWREIPFSDDLLSHEPPLDPDQRLAPTRTLELRSDLHWERLDPSFRGTSSPPTPCPFFTVLYYLFPCNVLRWMRNPVSHLEQVETETPYTVPWSEALDEEDIRAKSENILKSHVCHPLIIQRDAETELAAPDFWRSYDVPRIVSEASLLDIQTAALAVREMEGNIHPSTTNPLSSPEFDTIPNTISNTESQASLESMIKTSVFLKSGFDFSAGRPSIHGRDSITPSSTVSPAKPSTPLPDAESQPQQCISPSPDSACIISSLHREVLLLRNELQFEIWLSRENTKNIGRLYREQNATQGGDVERLGLYIKLRKYRAQVMELERALQEQRNDALAAKDQSADYNGELQGKLREFREEKKAWITETAHLRTAERDAKAQFDAQEKLVKSASHEVFALKAYKKENQHKIDRLHDYERQIEKHVKDARSWDDDFARFKSREDEITTMRRQIVQMGITLDSHQRAMNDVQHTARGQVDEINHLRQLLEQKKRKELRNGRHDFAKELDLCAKEKHGLGEMNVNLREQRDELLEEVEDLRSMVEYLKSQATGKNGLVGEERGEEKIRINYDV